MPTSPRRKSRRNATPSYLEHKASGRARAVWTGADGIRHDKLLPGDFNSAESLHAFAAKISELATLPIARLKPTPNTISVNEVLLAFHSWAGTHYRDPDGEPTTEVKELKLSLKPVRELYGMTRAEKFGPLALRAVRERMIALGWCRTLINKRIDRVKRCFKWAVSMELVPSGIYEALRTVAGLKKGRTEARESEPVKPVDPATVAATLPMMNAHVRAMVELQLLTGMRPAEVCRLNLAEVDRSGDVWLYKPIRHKTQHRDKNRVIPLGPQAQSLILAYLEGRLIPDEQSLFSPRLAREERFASMRAARKSKVQPSQASRKKVKPKLLPKLVYTPHSYAHAVADAAEKAGVMHWHPNQLRHTHGTKVRKKFGLEAAGASLGHEKMSATEIYAERNESLAVEVAAKIG